MIVTWAAELCRTDRFAAAMSIIFMILLGISAGATSASAAPRFSAIAVDARTGKVLSANDPDGQRHPASLTKMMTLYLVFEDLKASRIKLNSPIRFSSRACAMAPSKLGVKPGSTVTVETAIKALVVKSANDVASAVAETLGGTESQFAARMTRKARELGMSKTTFRNASGLPNPGQVTTARDMATLGLRLMRDFPQYYPYFKTASFTFAKRTIRTHNRLLGRYQGTDGIKTGYINASGYNLVSSVRRGDKRLVGVVMGGKSGKSRNVYMMNMLDRTFSKAKGGKTIAALAGSSKGAIEPNGQGGSAGEVKVVTPKLKPAAGEPAEDQTLEQLAANAAAESAEDETEDGSNEAEAAAATSADANPTVIESSVGGASALPEKLPFEVKPEAKQSTIALNETAPPSADWNIQIGPYRDKSEAQRELKSLRAIAPDVLDGKKAFTVTVEKGGERSYRARFAGFTEDGAKDACRLLQAQAPTCYVLPPRS